MKKLITILFVLIFSVGYAQEVKTQSQDTLRLRDFSTWAIAPYISKPFQSTDIGPISNGYQPTNIGLGINLEKHLSHYVSLQFGLFDTELNTETPDVNYNTHLTQYDAKLCFHIVNGHTIRTFRNTQLFFYGGVGKLRYRSNILDRSTNIFTDETNGNALVLLSGAGLKYKVGHKATLFTDLSYNYTNTDKLDAVKVNYTNNDAYLRLSLGFTYTFGSKPVLEWDNPYKYLVPEEVHDTTVVLTTIKYVPPKVQIIWPDSATIYFIPGSSSIEFPYLSTLDSVIKQASEHNYFIEIHAYCDSTGTQEKNKELVMKRAENVKDYVSKFISSESIAITLYDESSALYMPSARNRKVVVKLIKTQE